MCKNSFSIVVTGTGSKSKILGTLVESSGNLVSEFRRVEDKIIFYFRYRSDARLVLRRAARSLGKTKPDSVDILTQTGVKAQVRRVL